MITEGNQLPSVIYYSKSYLYEMKIIFADDGIELTADSYEGIVSQLREQSPLEYPDNKSYMQNFARRAVIADDLDIRFTSEEEFVRDLQTSCIIIII